VKNSLGSKNLIVSLPLVTLAAGAGELSIPGTDPAVCCKQMWIAAPDAVKPRPFAGYMNLITHPVVSVPKALPKWR